jgi:hypothetical protein
VVGGSERPRCAGLVREFFLFSSVFFQPRLSKRAVGRSGGLSPPLRGPRDGGGWPPLFYSFVCGRRAGHQSSTPSPPPQATFTGGLPRPLCARFSPPFSPFPPFDMSTPNGDAPSRGTGVFVHFLRFLFKKKKREKTENPAGSSSITPGRVCKQFTRRVCGVRACVRVGVGAAEEGVKSPALPCSPPALLRGPSSFLQKKTSFQAGCDRHPHLCFLRVRSPVRPAPSRHFPYSHKPCWAAAWPPRPPPWPAAAAAAAPTQLLRRPRRGRGPSTR